MTYSFPKFAWFVVGAVCLGAIQACSDPETVEQVDAKHKIESAENQLSGSSTAGSSQQKVNSIEQPQLYEGPLYKGPKIASPQPEFEFGEKESGTEVTGTFTIINQGDQPLKISKVLPGVGCTSAKISRKVIPPREGATIKAVLPLRLQKGPMRKDVLVKSNDPDNPNFKLYLVGTAVLPIRVEPQKLILGKINAHAGGEHTIDLIAPSVEKKFQIQSVEVGDEDSLSVRVEEVEKDTAYRIHLSMGKDLTPGQYRSFVRIRTDNKQFNVIGIPVTARVTGELTVKPSEIKLFSPRDKNGVNRNIVIGPDMVKNFKVTEVQSPDSSLETKITAVGRNKYIIRISGLKPSTEINGKFLVIKTDAPGMNTIRIPIRVIKTGHSPRSKGAPVSLKKANKTTKKVSTAMSING